MSRTKPTYQELEKRLAATEPLVEAIKHHEVDAIVSEGKITFLLLRKVEEALISSEAGFQVLFDLPGVGMVQADTPALLFTRVNQRFCEMAGYASEELLSKTYLHLTHPRDRHRDMKVLSQVLRGKADSWSIEKRCLRKDGSTIWVRVHGSALRDTAGRIVRILAMITDLTESRKATQECVAAEKQLKKQVRELTAELTKSTVALVRLKKAAVKKSRGTAEMKASDTPRLKRH